MIIEIGFGYTFLTVTEIGTTSPVFTCDRADKCNLLTYKGF